MDFNTDTDKPIYIGGTVKALDNGVIGGYLVSFTDEGQRDLVGEYFTKDTDFWTDKGYPLTDLKVLYHHGLDQDVKVKSIGIPVKAEVTDAGIWFEAQSISAELRQIGRAHV